MPSMLSSYDKRWLKFDVAAGLVTGTVVIPKAMAYATVAGLPVQVGLYTALVPMLAYALLGSSRVLSVSTTTTLAILTGTELSADSARRRSSRLDGHSRRPHFDRRRHSRAGLATPPGIRRQLHLRAGADRLQGRNRARHHRGSDSEAARHPFPQGRLRPQPDGVGARCGRHVAGRPWRSVSAASLCSSPSSGSRREHPRL